MSTIEEHCKASLERFGEEFRPFHKIIDCYCYKKGRDSEGEFDYTDERDYRHKEKLHTIEFIEIIREMYGERVAEAMRLHIFQDFEGTEFEGLVPARDDYRIGFWSRLQKWKRE